MALSIGLDVGGTNIRLGVFEGSKLIDETRFQADFSRFCKEHAPDEAWQKILRVTANAIQSVITKHPDVQTIGIGFPGFINPKTQLIAQSPNLPGLKNVNLAADLSQLIGKKVIVENDANAAAFGEYSLAGKPEGGLIYLCLGTGVGGGFVDASGKLYSGQHGVAMEVGHIIVPDRNRSACRAACRGVPRRSAAWLTHPARAAAARRARRQPAKSRCGRSYPHRRPTTRR